MAERRIIGVDFSGGGEDNEVGNTWVTEGHFVGATTLRIDNCRAISRDDLTNLLMGLPPSAIVAMDFPFGVPHLFAAHEFGFAGNFMHEMWEIISDEMQNQPNYIAELRPRLGRGGDLQQFNSLIRQWDSRHFPEAYSPLSRGPPEMFPMTFRGMKMLHTLWACTNCRVPPLDNNGRTGPVLLETMPGVLLSSFWLPDTRER